MAGHEAKGVVDILSVNAARHPDKVAFVDDRPGRPPVSSTFAELHSRRNQLAALLVERGFGPGTKVAWCGHNSGGVLVVIAALRKIGATAVPLNYHLTSREAAYIVANSDAELVLVSGECEGLIQQIRPDTPKVSGVLVFDGDGSLEARLARMPDGEPGSPQVPGSDIFYTSGTTGAPKGAVRPPAADPRQGGLADLIGYTPDDVYLTTGPIYHSGPARFLNLAQAFGNTVVLQHHFDAEDWLRLVKTHRVTTTFSAPAPIRKVCTLPAATIGSFDRSSMKRLIGNAAPWTMALKERYLGHFPADSLWEIYGATEIGVATVLAPEDQLRKPRSCGRPAPGVDIKLFDDSGDEVLEPDTKGDLYVRSASMFSSYHQAEEKYDKARRGDYHTVGDVAYRDREGYYYIVDRKSDMIITGGVNVYPAEIEAVIEKSPDVYEVAAFGIPSEEWGECVHAVVVPTRRDVTDAEVIKFARTQLAGYKVPRSVTFLEELPKNGSGKVLKRELRLPFWSRA